MRWDRLRGRAVCFLVLIALGWPQALRANSFLEISPGLVEITGRPGQKSKGQFTVNNPGNAALAVRVEIEDGWRQQTGRPSPVEFSRWLNVKGSREFVVGPQSKKRLTYSVEVPDSMEGESMAMVYFSRMADPSESGAAVGVRFRHGIPVYVANRGTEKAQVVVKEMNAALDEWSKGSFTVTLACEGNIHVRPRGEWVVKDVFGSEVDRVVFPHGLPIFPGRERKYAAKTAVPRWTPGVYRIEFVVSFGEGWDNPGEVRQVYRWRIEEGGKTSLEGPVSDGPG